MPRQEYRQTQPRPQFTPQPRQQYQPQQTRQEYQPRQNYQAQSRDYDPQPRQSYSPEPMAYQQPSQAVSPARVEQFRSANARPAAAPRSQEDLAAAVLAALQPGITAAVQAAIDSRETDWVTPTLTFCSFYIFIFRI